MHPIVYVDALRLNIRDEATVKNKAVYRMPSIRAGGRKEVLGLWIEQTEGAKFSLRIFSELKNRGYDILSTLVDGLCGFPEAIKAIYPVARTSKRIGRCRLSPGDHQKQRQRALEPFGQCSTEASLHRHAFFKMLNRISTCRRARYRAISLSRSRQHNGMTSCSTSAVQWGCVPTSWLKRRLAHHECGCQWLYATGEGGKRTRTALPTLARDAIDQYLGRRQLLAMPEQGNSRM